MGWFDGVLTDVGDEQSLARSLSTFSAHIEKLASFVECADSQTLVLLDEVAAGTDPEEGSALAVAVLAAIPGLIKFDALYWWAGRLWGERFIVALPGSRRVARHMPRLEQAGRKVTWPAVVASSFLPIPKAIVFVVAGWTGMRLITFMVLDLTGALLWSGLLSGLGYTLGHDAVVAATTISRYSWWFTIGIVALTVFFVVRSQRRQMAVAAVPGDQDGR